MKDVQFIETCPAFKSPIFCWRNMHGVCLFTKRSIFHWLKLIITNWRCAIWSTVIKIRRHYRRWKSKILGKFSSWKLTTVFFFLRSVNSSFLWSHGKLRSIFRAIRKTGILRSTVQQSDVKIVLSTFIGNKEDYKDHTKLLNIQCKVIYGKNYWW